MSAFIEIRQLSKSYSRGDASQETRVLRDVSVTFERGSFSAIVGPSGCGKTTLLGVLGALDDADSGSVVVEGLDLLKATRAELVAYRRSAVGIIFQFYNLMPSLTALENVETGIEFLHLTGRARRQRAMDYLARVGMAEHASRFPAQLSGGQQQRVAVARVLAREPRLLLADEPTGNLDEESGERVFACIKDLQQESGVTCIMVTHDATLASRVDAVVKLRAGRLVDESGVSRAIESRIVPARSRPGVRLTSVRSLAIAEGQSWR
jgi:putative ABC transport system ATP-binding protein